MCASYSLLAGLAFVSVFVSLFVSVFVSGLLAVFSLPVEVVLVLSVLAAAAVEFAEEPEFELAPVLEPVALSFL